MRKIIQITGTGIANNASTQCNFFLWALCDDGTVWRRDDNTQRWESVPPIPQAKQPDPPERLEPIQAAQPWPPSKVTLWTMVDGEALKIVDRDTFWIAVASDDQIVDAFYQNDAQALLNDPSGAPDHITFVYEGREFTVPSDPIPF